MIHVETAVEAPWPAGGWDALAARAVGAAVAASPHGDLARRPFVAEVSVRLTCDDEVRALNRQYREQDKATNVLSFPMVQPDLLDALADTDDGEVLLGDVVVAHGVTAAEAAAKGMALEAHVAHLIVHGVLHLLGYDHERGEDEAEAMEDIERAALAALGLPDPYARALMPENSDGGRLWAGLRGLLFGDQAEPTLRDQIEEAIDEHEEQAGDPAKGDLSAAERQMLRNLLDFGERTAGDVGVPRGEIMAVPETIAFAELVSMFADAGHSRLPVYRESLDHVIGMVHIKDVFAILARGEAPPAAIGGLIRQPRYVPESMGVIDLLAEMRATRTHLAIVLDEYSGTEGLVTIEDIVEEIVGQIEDEHDEAPAPPLVALDDGVWDADARAELDEVAELIDPRLGEVDEDVDTLGGLASVLAGHVPQVGETVAHPSGWRLEITAADPRRVERLRLHPPAETAMA